MTKNELFERIVSILTDSFEIETARITPEARLYDDLDIDSIDAVDLIVQLKPLLGRNLQPEAFKAVRTDLNASGWRFRPSSGLSCTIRSTASMLSMSRSS